MDFDIEEISLPPSPCPVAIAATPPCSPPAIEIHHLIQQRRCAELRQSIIEEHAATRQQLAQTVQRRDHAVLKVRVAQSLRSAAAVIRGRCHVSRLARLESIMEEHAATRQQLAQTVQRRDHAVLKVRVAQSLRSAAAVIRGRCHSELQEVRKNCRRMLAELEHELRWRPASITMDQIHQRELINRVTRLQSILSSVRSRRALPSERPHGGTCRV